MDLSFSNTNNKQKRCIVKKCQNCNSENPQEAKFCETCGMLLLPAEQGHDSEEESPKSQALRYDIQGSDMQFVSFRLRKGQTIIAEAGSLMYMDDNIKIDTSIFDGSESNGGFWSSLLGAGQRILTGESFFLTHYTGIGNVDGEVAFSAPYPGKIVPIDLQKYSSAILCQKGAFLAASYGTKMEIAFTRNLAAGFLGGEGFILQRLIGNDMAFVHSCGKIVELKLHNQTIKINPGCIVAFEESIKYSITPAGNFTTMLFGTKTIFLATLSGTGSIWLQSMPFNMLANRICSEGINQGLFEKN